MFVVPFKGGCLVNFAKPMKKYIKSQYSKDEAGRQEAAITQLEKYRNAALQADRGGETALESLLDYLAVIRNVRDKLPIPAGGKLRISFGWMDAFNRGCTTNKYSWDFEAACVWYNVGAIHSLMGAHQDRSSTSGIKGAHQHFQKAVAVFSHIKNELVTDLQGTLPAEFTQSGLDLCIEIHRGHAQSCFYEKAKMAGMKPGVLARLAMQASQYYDSALTHAQSPSISKFVTKSGWVPYLKYKAEVFRAAAEWQQACQAQREAEAKSEGYGVEIAWLQKASNTCRGAIRHATQGNDRQSAEGLQKAIDTRLTQAVEDNNVIYIEPVPRHASLPAISPVSMVKPVPAPDLAARSVPSLFSALVPPEITLANADFKEQQRELCIAKSNEARERKEQGNQQLDKLGLPAAVEARGSASGLPDTLWHRIRCVQAAGGMREITTKLPEVESLVARVTDLLNRAEGMLAEEEMTDQQCRSRWGERYKCPKSSELNGEYRAELRNKRTMLSKVQADLHHVHATLDGAKEAIDNLKWNRQQLAAQVPDGGSSSVGETERLQLANSLRELGELLIAREALVEEMMKMVDKVDIKGALVRAGGVAHKEEVFSHASTELDAKRAEIAASISSQAELMARIARENDIFNAAKSSDDANNEREKRLRNLSDAVNAFETIVSDIKHIQLTLTELDRKADTFKNDVSGYIVAREMTREEQVMNLGGAADGAGTGSGGGRAGHADTSKDEEFARKLQQEMEDERKGGGGGGDGAPQPPPRAGAPAPAAAPAHAPPAYGQPPAYGAARGAPPAYGAAPAAAPPAYGAAPAAPAYGHAPPAYGQAPPAYGRPPAAYGQPPAGYGQPPAYGQPPGGYHAAPGGYHAPPAAYGAPPASGGYAPPASHAPPHAATAPPASSAPPSGYAAPAVPTYATVPAAGQYGAPAYGAAPGYAPPPQGANAYGYAQPAAQGYATPAYTATPVGGQHGAPPAHQQRPPQ